MVEEREKTEKFAEAAQRSLVLDPDHPALDLVGIISKFMEKTLTYPTDALRAISGILHTMHGTPTSFEMLCEDFDFFIEGVRDQRERKFKSIMKPDSLSTWSWASACGPIDFDRAGRPVPNNSVYSLAYWGQHATRQSGAQSRPHWYPFVLSQYKRSGSSTARMLAALAWLSGCTRSSPPQWLAPDCSKGEYEQNLQRNWDTIKDYQESFFDSYANLGVFDEIDLGQTTAAGKIAVHTQNALFRLEKEAYDPETGKILVRACATGKIAGAIILESEPVDEGKQMTCIALSVNCYSIADPESNDQRLPSRRGLEDVQCREWVQAFGNHHSVVWAFDSLDFLKWAAHLCEPPKLTVMLVSPATVQHGTTMVYERLGIGTIYLKRWLEADPKFETIVLEQLSLIPLQSFVFKLIHD